MNKIILAAQTGNLIELSEYRNNPDLLNARDEDGATPLMWASLAGHVPIVEWLLQNHADVAAQDNHQETALTWAAINHHREIIRLLLVAGTPLTLSSAIMLGDTAVITELVRQKPDLNARILSGTTPVLLAAEHGQRDVLLLLLQLGGDLFACDEFGSALTHAADRGDVTCVQALLELGLPPDYGEQCQDVGTNLFVAVMERHFEVVRLLLESGIDVNRTDDVGTSPLMTATLEGQADMVRLLLAYGANIHATDHMGNTALTLAQRQKNSEIIKIFQERTS